MIAENLFKKLKENISKSTIFLFALSIIIYGPFIFTQLNNADDNTFGYLYHASEYATENNQGRFAIRFFDIWRNSMVSPVLIVIPCLIFLCATAQIVCKILEIKSDILRVLIGSMIVLSPSMADLFTYYYAADSYCFAYFLIALSVYFMLNGKSKLRWLCAGICMVLSLSIYQAYIGFAIFLISVRFMVGVLFKEDENPLCKGKLISLFGSYVCTGISMLTYYVIFKILTLIGYTNPATERGMGGMFETIFKFLPSKIIEMYRAIYEYFFTDVIISNSWFGRKYLNCVVVLLIIILLIMLIRDKRFMKKPSSFVLLIFTLFMTVSSFTVIVVLGPNTSIYAETGMLMLPYMNGLYILMLVLSGLLIGNGKKSEIVVFASEGTSILLLIIMTVFIQVFAGYINQQQKQITSLATRVSYRIEELGDYEEGQKVLVVGRPHNGNFSLPDEQYENITKGMISHYSMIFGADHQISMGWIHAFEYYIGIHYKEVSSEEREALLNSSEVSSMGIYPAWDSVKRIGDTVVVKFSE